MSRSTLALAATVITSAVAACADPPTAVGPLAFDEDLFVDLLVAVPVVGRTDLAPLTSVTIGDPATSGPSRAVEDDDWVPAVMTGAKTKVGFFTGEAYAEGQHKYQGNASRIETTAHVAFQSAHLGSQTAVEQDYSWVPNLSASHFIFAYAAVRTDHPCGLAVSGSSRHRAWWQAFTGPSAPTWGTVELSTSAGPAAQGACGQKVSNTDPTGGTTTSNGIVCTYLITYDLDTLEIVKVELLYCQSGGGVEM